MSGMAPRHALLTIGLIIALMAGGRAVADQASERFVTGIGDLPLMSGLTEDPEQEIIFDKPNGRIVEVVASGAVEAQAVGGFYDRVLGQLGWHRQTTGKQVFERDGEILRLTISAGGGQTTIRFTLAPEHRESTGQRGR